MNLLNYIFPVFFSLNNTNVQMNDTMIVHHLLDYGYINDMNASDAEMKSAIQEYQYFIGSDPTGEINNETLNMMVKPRCGKPDHGKERTKRYTFLGNQTWQTTELRYQIDTYPANLNGIEIEKEFSRAFNIWSEHTKINFKKVDNAPDIAIKFKRLDGEGRIYGFALNPTRGTVILDQDEQWTKERDDGVNLFQVAVHEFGHSLGLGHSSKYSSIMYPYYMGYSKDFKLDIDDIKGIKALYKDKLANGQKLVGNNTYLCDDPKIDAIFTAPDNYVYVFKDDKYWKLSSNLVMVEGPNLIKSRWPELPTKIDAAFTSWNNITFFFKGNFMWKYILDQKYGRSKLISIGFDNIPNNLDAAFIWSGNGHLHFFKGDKFWVFNFFKPPKMRIRHFYPLPISYWYGVPNKIDAAVSVNGATYFFKNRSYYKYDDMNLKVLRGYPKSTAKDFFGCSKY